MSDFVQKLASILVRQEQQLSSEFPVVLTNEGERLIDEILHPKVVDQKIYQKKG